MLGMNDGRYRPLTPAIESDYVQGFEHLLNSIHQTLPTARFTLLGPSPYDEVTRSPMFPAGYNSTLVHFSELDAELARKHNGTYVDLNAPFVAALQRGMASNPLATEMLVPDRVHPEQPAHWFMAEAILKGWNAPAIVSSVTIDSKKLVPNKTINTVITDMQSENSGLTWTELDEALPLPIEDGNATTHFLRQITDVEEQLNQQPLKVLGLAPAIYELTIDSNTIGKFNSEELASGINLADYNTPMLNQSKTVGWALRDRDYTEFVRLRMYVDQVKNGEAHEKAQSELSDFSATQLKHIHEIAQPKTHKFQLKLVPAVELGKPN